jgi:hypothetical protein
MKKDCLECRSPFIGRLDAKFCSDACRSAYHNRTNKELRAAIQQVNAILKKNRKILARLNEGGTARVKKEELIRSGFNFNYLTNTFTTRKGKVYKFCYDQGYLDSEGDFLTLVVKKDYVV